MSFELLSLSDGSSELLKKHAVDELIMCNGYTEQYGITISREAAAALVETREYSLIRYGRIEFGGGVIEKIIKAFCDSPYIGNHNYEQTLHELIEYFYYYKNEAMGMVSDDDLISFMKSSFDGVCRGSLELLSGRELYNLAEAIKRGQSAVGLHEEFKLNEEEHDE